MIATDQTQSLPSAHIASLLEGSFDAFVLRDVDGTILSWNGAAERMYGYSADEAIGQPIDMLIPAERWDEYERNYAHVNAGEVIAPYETIRRRKDGSSIDTLVTAVPVKGENGKVVAVWTISHDVRSQKAAARALEEREKQFRDIAENFPGVIFRRVSWPDGRVEYPYVSDSLEVEIGIPLGWAGSIRTPEDLLAHVREKDLRRWQRALEEASARMTPLDIEVRIKGVDGQVRWVRSISRPQRRADGALLWDGVILDITDRKRAEDQLREKSAQLESIMDTVPAMIWLAHDPEGKRITGSRYAADFLRIPRQGNQSLTGPDEERPSGIRVLKNGGEVEAEELPVQRATRGEEVRNEELEIVFADGTSSWELVNASPIRDAEGQLTGAVGAGIDITERKRAQEHQMLLMSELDHRVKNFLATVQALVRQSLKSSPEADLLTGRIRALAVAHELLAQGNWRGANLNSLIERVLQPYQTGAAVARIRLQGPDAFLGSRPAQTLVLALNELATNAIKYGALSVPSGYIEVDWHVRGEDEQTLSLEWQERNGPEVMAPQGRGFGSRLIERSLSMEGGTGKLSFESAGLRCSIELPVGIPNTETAAAEQSVPPVTESADVGILAGKRVLVVEDEPLLAVQLEDALASKDCIVVGPVSRLETALDAALREPVNIAVLDVNLGGELVTPLAELLFQRKTPFVFLTGYGRLDGMPQHLRRTIIVRKPVHSSQLLSALAGALRETGSEGRTS